MRPKVLAVKSKTGLTGSERWVLDLECGHYETRMKRPRGGRHHRPHPKIGSRVKCVTCDRIEDTTHAD